MSLKRYIYLSVIAGLMACNNERPGKDTGINSKDDGEAITEVAFDTFRPTAVVYPEYSTFETDEIGYDPCELLTMQSVTILCKPTASVNIFNQNKKREKSCVYSWMGEDGKTCQVTFSIIAYSLSHEKLISLFKPDKDGIIQHSDNGVRWISGNKILTVSYIGEVIRKVNILDIKRHVKVLK